MAADADGGSDDANKSFSFEEFRPTNLTGEVNGKYFECVSAGRTDGVTATAPGGIIVRVGLFDGDPFRASVSALKSTEQRALAPTLSIETFPDDALEGVLLVPPSAVCLSCDSDDVEILLPCSHPNSVSPAVKEFLDLLPAWTIFSTGKPA